MPSQKVKVAIVGLGFGADFIPIYQNHPHAELYAICQRSEEKLKAAGKNTELTGFLLIIRICAKSKNLTQFMLLHRRTHMHQLFWIGVLL